MKHQPVGCDGIRENTKMKKTAQAIALTQTKARIDSDVMGIVGAVTLGLMLLFAAGFAQATVMHDTAHDTRHAMAFPCH